MRVASCFVPGDTLFTSTTNGAWPRPPPSERIASSTEPAVKHTNTVRASRAAATGLGAAMPAPSARACAAEATSNAVTVAPASAKSRAKMPRPRRTQ
jgi:hypothetical protein